MSPRFAAQRAKLLSLNQLSIKQRRTVQALVRVIVPAAKTSKQGDWNQIPKRDSLMGTSSGEEWKCRGKEKAPISLFSELSSPYNEMAEQHFNALRHSL